MNWSLRFRRSIVAVAASASIVVVACGSDDAGDGDSVPATTDSVTDDSVTDDSLTDDSEPASVDPTGDVIGTGNVGGTVVDPQPHPIDGVDIAESYPEQLMVRFTSGDPNCTAADATATADGDTVVVQLLVGITEDALTRSCLAGDVEQSVAIALTEGLDGRDVVEAG